MRQKYTSFVLTNCMYGHGSSYVTIGREETSVAINNHEGAKCVGMGGFEERN